MKCIHLPYIEVGQHGEANNEWETLDAPGAAKSATIRCTVWQRK